MPSTIQHQGAVEVSIDGRTIPGPWRALSGGQASADGNPLQPGHMLPTRHQGGPASRENVIARRLDDLPEELMNWLDSRVGSASATISHIKLDQNKAPYRRRTFTGVLLRCEPAEYDSTSNDFAELEFEFGVDGP